MSARNLAVIDDAFSDTRVKLIRNQVAPDAPDDVFFAMIDIAKRRGLDPLAKQISVLKFSGKWQIMTTIDGYRSLAEQTGMYAGSDQAVFTHDEDQHVDSATVTVWKMVAGQRCPFTAKVFMSEYRGPGPIWENKPYTMLAKVAESHALRKAFPSVMSGLYTHDEMDQATAQQPRSAPQQRVEAPRDLPYVIDAATGEIIDEDHDDYEETNPITDRKYNERAYHSGETSPLRPPSKQRFASNVPDANAAIATATIQKLHGYATNEFGWDHNTLSNYCKGYYGVASMTEMTEAQGMETLRRFNATGGMKQDVLDLIEDAAQMAYEREQ